MNIVKLNIDRPDKSIIKSAVDILINGGLVVYPTDTTYGLGVNAFSPDSIVKCYNVKRRSYKKPTHVIIKGWKMLKEISVLNKIAKNLYDKLLPGPLTLILKKKSIVPNVLTADLDTIGVRVPDCKITRLISKGVNFPYTTPSANREGEPTPYSLDDLKTFLDLSKIDLILDAGKLPPTPPSTIVDVTTSSIKILREGPISKRQILEAIP